jgi:hypothetical protein
MPILDEKLKKFTFRIMRDDAEREVKKSTIRYLSKYGDMDSLMDLIKEAQASVVHES